MPIYTFVCECGHEEEHILKADERDSEFKCPNCDGVLRWQGIERFTKGKPSFQSQAILGSGAHVKGHFGKEARKKGGWHRP
jgi:putative FmdB family regulatory protein